jgi:ABC-type amino acid transport substrate-binding protein
MRGAAVPVACAVALAVLLAAQAGAAEAQPRQPARPVVVALSLGDPALQAGVVRGRDVILARGFEVELARTLARRLGTRIGRFVDVRPPEGLPAAGPPTWHLAFAAIEPSHTARRTADLSVPYLTTDLAVVLRRGLDRPRRLADLRPRLLCMARGTGALEVVRRAVRPTRAPLVAAGIERLRSLVRAGACDAAVLPAVEAGRFVASQVGLLGPVAGRIEHGEGLVVAVARGSGIGVATVDRELRRLRTDGTLGRLARMWLALDPATLRRLR